MTYPQYEKPIDSVEDMLSSDKPLMVINSMKFLFVTDPRPQVNKLSKKVTYYDFEMKRMPQEILDGYCIIDENEIPRSRLIFPSICRTYIQNSLVILGPGSRGNFGLYLPEGAYKSKRDLFSGATAFQLPTASPLHVSIICL